MKPITTVTILYRDPMDPETPIKVKGIELDSVGDLILTLTRDEMGLPILESAHLKEQPGFAEQLKETRASLQAFHECMAKLQLLASHANTDLFALHKWLEH